MGTINSKGQVEKLVVDSTFPDEIVTYLRINTGRDSNDYLLDGEARINQGDMVNFSYSPERKSHVSKTGFPITSIERIRD